VVVGRAARTEPYVDQPFHVGSDVAGYELALMPDAEPSDGPIVHWSVADVEAAVSSALAAGAVEHTPLADVVNGTVTAAGRPRQVRSSASSAT